jgi:uncharacterized membrane protein YsdA (DUF1294 family)
MQVVRCVPARAAAAVYAPRPSMAPLLWFCLAANVVAFLLFALDKCRARKGGRRVREAHLLLAMAATGAPGGWVGMNVLRHKTRKASFRWKAVLATAINALWLWLWLSR